MSPKWAEKGGYAAFEGVHGTGFVQVYLDCEECRLFAAGFWKSVLGIHVR